jgi:hypothetical protein
MPVGKLPTDPVFANILISVKNLRHTLLSVLLIVSKNGELSGGISAIL